MKFKNEINVKSKTIKGVIIGIIVGGIVFGRVGDATVSLTANQISYTPEISNFSATNECGRNIKSNLLTSSIFYFKI